MKNADKKGHARHGSAGFDNKRRIPQHGDAIDVWWDDRDLIFRGKLGPATSSSPRSPRKPQRQFRYTIYYDDGDVFVHDLNRMTWRFVEPTTSELGKWIEPGELEARSIRAFKTSQSSAQSEPAQSERCSSKRNRALSTEKVCSRLQPRVKSRMTQGDVSTKDRGNDYEQPIDSAPRDDSPDVDMKENNSNVVAKSDVKDDEKYVLEALLLLSDNSNLGLIPSSPVPYRKRHHVRYISSIAIN